MKIIGLKLPKALESDLDAERTTLKPNEITRLAGLLSRVDRPFPAMYDLQAIQRENKLWASAAAKCYLGVSSSVVLPGDVDPRSTLIIGQADMDSPIVLDYRTEPPRVLYFGDVEHTSYWLELAPTYEALIAKIRSVPTNS